MSAGLNGYDPGAQGVLADPYPYFREAHRSCPVHLHRLSEPDTRELSANPLVAEPTTHYFSVFPYEQVREVLAEAGTFSSRQGPGPERLVALNGVGMLIYADEPVHSSQRQIVNKALNPRLVAGLEDRIRAVANNLLDEFAGKGSVDIVPAFADALPGIVFAELLGVPSSDVPTFRRWAGDLIGAFGGDQSARDRSIQTMAEIGEYFLALAARRREIEAGGGELPNDLLTGLITTKIDGRRFDDTDLLLAIHVLLVAGHETTASAVANGVWLFARYPEQADLVRAEPERIPAAIEEILRFESPIQSDFRTANTDVTCAGTAIAANDKVRVVYGAANRDPAVFDRPDEFDVTRSLGVLRKHVAFGFGPHHCVGSALARSEMRIAFEALFSRLSEWRLDPANPPVRADNLLVRSFGSLPICWDPGPRDD